MVDGIVICVRAGVLLDDHLERLRHLRGLFRCSTQPEEGGIESGDVLLEDLGRVALRIRGDEQHLDLSRVDSQLPPGGGELAQRRRADIWAMRIAEEHGYDL